MKASALLILICTTIILGPISAIADDVYVNGYTRSDGTYVRPHVRSSPDGSVSNNYGPSHSDSELMAPRTRDNDRDGTPNYLDTNDDNDSSPDNLDSNQYSPSW